MVNRVYKEPPAPGTPRHRIIDLNNNLDAEYAVFRRSQSGRSAHFQAIHETEALALEVARIHASESVARGDTDFTYYVVQIKHRLGIENGKPVDKAVA
jgi:hypothetical protein